MPGTVQGISGLYGVSADGSDVLTRLPISSNSAGAPEFVGSMGSPALLPVVLSLEEVINVADRPAVNPSVVLKVDESIAVVDAPRVRSPVVINLQEPVRVSDAPVLQLPVIVSIDESIAVTDAPVVRPSVVLSVPEMIGVRDAPLTRPVVTISVRESVGVSDASAAIGSNSVSILILPDQPAVLTLPGGRGSIDFPAGLVSSPTLFIYTPTASPAHPLVADQVFAGRSFTLDAVDVATNAPVHQLLTNYTINQTYDLALLNILGVQPTDLNLSFWNGAAYQLFPDRTQLAAQTILATRLEHVTEFALLAIPSTSPIGGGPPLPSADTPELDSLLLLGIGLAGLLGYAARRRGARA